MEKKEVGLEKHFKVNLEELPEKYILETLLGSESGKRVLRFFLDIILRDEDIKVLKEEDVFKYLEKGEIGYPKLLELKCLLDKLRNGLLIEVLDVVQIKSPLKISRLGDLREMENSMKKYGGMIKKLLAEIDKLVTHTRKRPINNLINKENTRDNKILEKSFLTYLFGKNFSLEDISDEDVIKILSRNKSMGSMFDDRTNSAFSYLMHRFEIYVCFKHDYTFSISSNKLSIILNNGGLEETSKTSIDNWRNCRAVKTYTRLIKDVIRILDKEY